MNIRPVLERMLSIQTHGGRTSPCAARTRFQRKTHGQPGHPPGAGVRRTGTSALHAGFWNKPITHGNPKLSTRGLVAADCLLAATSLNPVYKSVLCCPDTVNFTSGNLLVKQQRALLARNSIGVQRGLLLGIIALITGALPMKALAQEASQVSTNRVAFIGGDAVTAAEKKAAESAKDLSDARAAAAAAGDDIKALEARLERIRARKAAEEAAKQPDTAAPSAHARAQVAVAPSIHYPFADVPRPVEDALAAKINSEKAKQEREEAFDAERVSIQNVFREGTLEEQVKAADEILVLQIVQSQSVRVSGAHGMEFQKSLQAVETLKKSRTGRRGLPRPPSVVRSSSDDEAFPKQFHFPKWRDQNFEAGETFVYFTARSEVWDVWYEFVFAMEGLELPAQTEDPPRYYAGRLIPSTILPTFIQTPRGPAELIADIKAILEKGKEEERDAQGD